ncbi:MAG: hypothetical protein ACPGSD_12195 [Flavobacteriales bacterium]|jgi:hypothetical protein
MKNLFGIQFSFIKVFGFLFLLIVVLIERGAIYLGEDNIERIFSVLIYIPPILLLLVLGYLFVKIFKKLKGA